MSESSSLLSNYEKILHDRIEDLRARIHEAHNPIYDEGLMIEIETLQWVLSQENRSKPVSELLDLALQAAGGLERWRGVESLDRAGCINSRGTKKGRPTLP